MLETLNQNPTSLETVIESEILEGALTLVSSRLCRELKQHRWFYVEDVCELGDRRDAGAAQILARAVRLES